QSLLKVGESKGLQMSNLWIYVSVQGLEIYELNINISKKYHVILVGENPRDEGYVSQVTMNRVGRFEYFYIRNTPFILDYPFFDSESSARIFQRVVKGESRVFSNCRMGIGKHPFLIRTDEGLGFER
ncbi:MAG: hypothetical protein AABX66_01745, partial [Nanoarchaeota archaeon]